MYKIFTAATAMEKGLGIDYQLAVPPSGYASPIYLDGRGRPLPVPNAGDYPERLSLTDALALSPNTAFIKLEEFTGVPDVVDMAVRLGMHSLASTPFVAPDGRRTDRSIAEVTKAQKQASFTLGVTPTSVLELANVGATLASAGRWCPPSPIEKITDAAGNPVPLTEAPCEQVVDPGLANTLLTALSKDDTTGTAAGAARQVGWNRPMAGKTGTTQEHKSAAFIGIVPQMSGAVITFDNSNAPKPLCDGAGAPFPCREGNIFGGKTPAETWFGTMVPLLADQPVLPLPPRPALPGGRRRVEGAGRHRRRRERRPRPAEGSRLDRVHPRGRQRRRPGHRGGAEPVRHRAARRDHRAEHQQRRRATPARRARADPGRAQPFDGATVVSGFRPCRCPAGERSAAGGAR